MTVALKDKQFKGPLKKIMVIKLTINRLKI